VTFRLYENYSGGTALCSDTHNVGVLENGLFSSYINCDLTLYGQRVFLSIEVEGDGEMTPRQVIRPVPYALSLRPGAVISDTSDTLLTVRSTGSGDADAFKAYGAGSGEGVEASAEEGVGVFASSEDYIALQAYSTASPSLRHPAIFGCSADSWNDCDPYRDDWACGVMGYGGVGVYGVGEAQGVRGTSGTSIGFAGYFRHEAGGVALLADSGAADNQDIVRFNNDYVTRFKVQGDGDVYIDGSYYDSGADFAEMLPAQDGLEPGDVLIIGADGQLSRSTTPYQATVVGVFSSRPGFVGGAGANDDLTGKVPLAILGIVPVKASAGNGAIRPGDLLVSASTPGHTMRAGDNPPQGTVLGKALGELEEGTGVIEMLVTLQ
jgi:hypothetical protein